MNKLFFAALLIVVMSGVAVNAQTRRRPVVRKKTVRTRTTTVRRPLPTPTLSNANRVAATTTATGLTYLITKKGTGRQPKLGEQVVVHYTGTLTDGTKFDSSRDAGQPFEFQLGAGRVIKGWDEGIAKLSIGDQAILIIPSTLGYGARGAGAAIPPNATLIFIVELVDVK